MTQPNNYRRGIAEKRELKLDKIVTSRRSQSSEFCVNSPGDSPLFLYIESVRTPEVLGVPKIVIHYDVEKLDSKILKDPMEGRLFSEIIVTTRTLIILSASLFISKLEVLPIIRY